MAKATIGLVERLRKAEEKEVDANPTHKMAFLDRLRLLKDRAGGDLLDDPEYLREYEEHMRHQMEEEEDLAHAFAAY